MTLSIYDWALLKMKLSEKFPEPVEAKLDFSLKDYRLSFENWFNF